MPNLYIFSCNNFVLLHLLSILSSTSPKSGVSLSFESWWPSWPVTDKFRWPRSNLGGPDQIP